MSQVFGSSEGVEVLILTARREMIRSKCNFAAVARALQIKLEDVSAIVEEHPRLFSDLIKDPARPSVSLLADGVERVRIRTVRRALSISGGNVKLAAEILGIGRTTLTEQINKYGLRQGIPGTQGLGDSTESNANDERDHRG